MKVKKISIFVLSVMLCATLKELPVNAGTSWLDVKPGDIFSHYTYKDIVDWEDKFYVTPALYAGTDILGNSVSQDKLIGSGITHLATYGRDYTYGGERSPVGGIYYNLGCASDKDSNWQLQGWYTP